MPALQIYIDYPEENARISSNIYTFRIGTVPQAERVEISIDGGHWVTCRFGAGYWWYDWVHFVAGEHTLKARGFTSDGACAESKLRRFRRL